NGMYCSASHWMLSSSSSWVMRGMEIFLMMMLWPETPMATSRFFSLYWAMSCRMASTMAVEFIKAPSTIASGGSGATPNASRTYPRLASLSWTSFTDEDPMSSPSPSFLLAIRLSLPTRRNVTVPPPKLNNFSYLHLPAHYLLQTTEIHGRSLRAAMSVAMMTVAFPSE